MKYPFSNDDEILEALQSRAHARVNAAMEHLYRDERIRGAVRRQIKLQGGNESDVRDILNQALVAFLRVVESGKYDPSQSAIPTYMAGIAKKMFYTEWRSDQRRTNKHDRAALAQNPEMATNPELEFDLQHRRAFVHKLLAKLGEKCRELLLLKAQGYQMEEIAEKMPYKSADSAKAAHYDCRKKLNELTQRPEVLQALREL